MSENFIDQHDFNSYIREIAVCTVSFPSDLDEVAYLIPTPSNNLFCAVCPGFGIRDSKVDDPSGKVLLWNKSNKEVAHTEEIETDFNSWKDDYTETVEDVMANWREYVLR